MPPQAMPHEIEGKFRVESLAVVRKALRQAGAKHLVTVLQADQFYDLPDGTYFRNGCGLRLRCVKILRRVRGVRIDPRPEITFKGPVKNHAKVKIRQEIQTRLECDRVAHRLLLACGLKRVMSYSKRRSTYRLDSCLVELDELPLLGDFVEIEGPGLAAVERVRKRLRIEAEHIQQSYLQLLREACKKQGVSADSIRFNR